jgi:hypothetical protein
VRKPVNSPMNPVKVTRFCIVREWWPAKANCLSLRGCEIAGLLLGDLVELLMIGGSVRNKVHVCNTFNPIEQYAHIVEGIPENVQPLHTPAGFQRWPWLRSPHHGVDTLVVLKNHRSPLSFQGQGQLPCGWG